MPEVTVVIPTRNRWPVLARTSLAAALLQEDVGLEVVVVDDDSSADPPDEVAGLADPRVRVVRHGEVRGVAAARNTGIAESRGAWIAFLDDDDLWAPDKLRRQLDAVGAEKAGFAYAGAVWVDPELELVHGHAPPDARTLGAALLRWNVLWGGASNVLASTSLLRSLGGFDERLFQLADWDLWIRLASAAPAVALPEVLLALVSHADSMLLVDRRDVFAEFAYLKEKHRDAGRQMGTDLDAAAFARWVAGGHLRAGRRRAAAAAFVRGNRAPGNVARAAVALATPSLLAKASRLREVVPGALTEGQRAARRPDWLERYR